MKGRKPPVSTKCEMWNGLVDRVSSQEGTCSGLRDHVSGYELFKEHCDAVQDAQVKVLSDHVAELDSELMGMVVHLDEEFYLRFLTTIAALGLAIDKGMQTGLVAGIDHGKSRRSLADVAAYDPSVEAKFVSVVLAFRPSAKTPEGSRLQPSYEQLFLHIHRKEDDVVFRETSLSDSLDAIHARDFQNSPDDEEDTRSNQEFSSAKATDQTKCHKCGKKGHFTRECWSKTSVLSYQSPLQPKLLHSSEHKPKPRHTKDFEAKYNKIKAKLALLNSSTSAPSSSSRKNKGLIFELYDWDEEEVSSDDNDVTELKALMDLADEERVSVGKESVKNDEWIKIFIKYFLKIAKSLTELTKKNKKYIWGENQVSAFQLLKYKLCEAPIIALLEGNNDFVIYCDASHQGLRGVLMEREKVIAYTS
nr:putative reverse transcriptase domain-containing protein [Tanacetum cinerariifolium]